MLNKWTGIGYVGADPELRYTADGTPVAQFNLATSESWKDRNGTKKENTIWHKIVAWRKLAEICGEYVKKGSLLFVEGKLVIREYEDRDGNKRKTHEIVISEMKLLPTAKSSDAGSSGRKPAGSSGQQSTAYEDNDFPHEEGDEPPL